MDISAEELEARLRRASQADAINALLSQSNIKEASEAAAMREKEQSRFAEQRYEAELARQVLNQKHQNKLDEYEVLRGAGAWGGLAKPGAGESQQVRGAIGTAGALEGAAGAMEGQGGAKGYPEIAVEIARQILPSAGNALAEAIYSPSERDATAQMHQAMMDYRRTMSGTAVTAAESALGADWDPAATGISAEESAVRARNLAQWLRNMAANYGIPQEGEPYKRPAPVDPEPEVTYRDWSDL